MDDFRNVIAKRLKIAFNGETQETTAKKLHMEQGNVSKWLTGAQTPTTDTLFEISKAYKVSVDWLLGLSDCPQIDGLVIEKLTYDQLARLIDNLIQRNILEVPDISKLGKNEEQGVPPKEYDELETDELSVHEPVYDSDYLKVNDRLVSHLMRRRWSYIKTDPDLIEVWSNKLDTFRD